MQKDMVFYSNGRQFLINEYADGFIWSQWDGGICIAEGEAYDTASEAQQSAINRSAMLDIEEREQIEQEQYEMKNGTGEEFMRQEYYEGRI